MATIGMQGDVNNSIFLEGAYPVGRSFGMVPPAATSFDMRNNYAGELGGLNQDYRGMVSTNTQMTSTQAKMANGNAASNGRQPAMWWLTFAIVFVVVAWAARKFAPDGESFAIIKPNLINGVFATLWTILIIIFLKQIAIRVKGIPFLRSLADMVLSV
jgi:hypothetical protein